MREIIITLCVVVMSVLSYFVGIAVERTVGQPLTTKES